MSSGEDQVVVDISKRGTRPSLQPGSQGAPSRNAVPVAAFAGALLLLASVGGASAADKTTLRQGRTLPHGPVSLQQVRTHAEAIGQQLARRVHGMLNRSTVKNVTIKVKEGHHALDLDVETRSVVRMLLPAAIASALAPHQAPPKVTDASAIDLLAGIGLTVFSSVRQDASLNLGFPRGGSVSSHGEGPKDALHRGPGTVTVVARRSSGEFEGTTSQTESKGQGAGAKVKRTQGYAEGVSAEFLAHEDQRLTRGAVLAGVKTGDAFLDAAASAYLALLKERTFGDDVGPYSLDKQLGASDAISHERTVFEQAFASYNSALGDEVGLDGSSRRMESDIVVSAAVLPPVHRGRRKDATSSGATAEVLTKRVTKELSIVTPKGEATIEVSYNYRDSVPSAVLQLLGGKPELVYSTTGVPKATEGAIRTLAGHVGTLTHGASLKLAEDANSLGGIVDDTLGALYEVADPAHGLPYDLVRRGVLALEPVMDRLPDGDSRNVKRASALQRLSVWADAQSGFVPPKGGPGVSPLGVTVGMGLANYAN